jgi:hypothetical protein
MSHRIKIKIWIIQILLQKLIKIINLSYIPIFLTKKKSTNTIISLKYKKNFIFKIPKIIQILLNKTLFVWFTDHINLNED